MSILAGLPFLWPGQGEALDLSSGEVEASLDTTLSYGLMLRVEDQDKDLTSKVNDNDGNLNYEKGIVSNAAKFTSDFELNYREVGLFLRASGFYDHENEEGTRDYRPLTPAAKRLVGKDLDLLDAYVTGSFDLGESSVDLRLGKHVLNWGESTFIQNGINAINPFDVSKLRVPGAELREALVAVPMVSAVVELPNNLSVEAFYQIDWEKTQIDPLGTYFSTTDYVGPGATRAFLNDPTIVNALRQTGRELGDDPDFLVVRRAADRDPRDGGQGGVALRYLAEGLNNTEFGFYFVNYHSRLPTVSAHTGTGITGGAGAGLGVLSSEGQTGFPAAVDAYIKTGNYFIEYPEDIQLYGVSFSTQLGASGWALQGEYSFRPNVPLQNEEATLIAAGLAPFTGCLQATNPQACVTGDPANGVPGGALGTVGFDADVRGFTRRQVSQIQATATRVFGPTFGADSFVFLTEIAMLTIHDMPEKSVLPLESPAEGETSDETSMGYRMAARLDYNNAIGGANLFPYVQFQHDFSGNAPQPIAPFLEGRTALTLGLRVDYLSRWEGNISYTAYGGSRSEIRDRDFVQATIKYSF